MEPSARFAVLHPRRLHSTADSLLRRVRRLRFSLHSALPTERLHLMYLGPKRRESLGRFLLSGKHQQLLSPSTDVREHCDERRRRPCVETSKRFVEHQRQSRAVPTER